MAMLFSRDLMIAATAYIVADSEEEAQAKFDTLKNSCLELREDEDAEVPIFGGTYSLDMPDVSLSPSMTIHGPFPDDNAPVGGFEVVEEELEGDDEEQA